MDSSTSKTLRMKKLFIKKGFHFIVFAVKVLIDLSETYIWPSQGQGTWPKPSLTHLSATPLTMRFQSAIARRNPLDRSDSVDIYLRENLDVWNSAWKSRGEISKYFFTLRSPKSNTPGPNEPKKC